MAKAIKTSGSGTNARSPHYKTPSLNESMSGTAIELLPSEKREGDDAKFIISENIAHVTVVTGRLLDRKLASRLRKFEIPIGQWPFLMFLWADDSLTQRDLSRLMAIEESTVTNTIDRMVRDGLVLKEQASEDRRKNRLKLTRRAQQLRETLLLEAQENVRAATIGMAAEEISMLMYLLRKIQHNLADDVMTPLRNGD